MSLTEKKTFHKDGSVNEIYYVDQNNLKQGKSIYHYDNEYDNDIWDSCFYENNKIEGVRLIYYPYGKQINIRSNYVGSKLSGDYEEYYSQLEDYYGTERYVSTLKKKCSYIDGKLNGDYIEYFPSGKIEKKCSYINGELNGDYKEFYDNKFNSIKIETTYYNGTLGGVYRKYEKDGTMTDNRFFLKGGIEADY